MKTKIIVVLLILAGLGAAVVFWKQSNGTPVLPVNQTTDATTEDMVAIRTFMADPALELSYVNTDLPMPYFRVGKVTKMGNGENMEAVEGWTRQVNIYNQEELLNGTCSVYEYHTDVKNHNLTAVVIRGLRPNEIEARKQEGITCIQSNPPAKINEEEAQDIAFGYLRRVLPNFEEIKDQFAYSESKSHIWFWEDKSYKLPDGLEGRPYLYPTIRITVNGDKTISYWNTVSLFEN